MDSGPLVSVIMPMLNSERFIEQAVRSILTQTYGSLECIVVDDGSADHSREIVENLQRSDSRIHLICLEQNRGVANASNIAIQNANGKYIARMDADDISLKDRFLLQVRFLENHPDVGILGARMRYMDERGQLLAMPPVFRGDLAIRWHMLFENPFFNPTIIMRKSIIDNLGLKYETSALYGDEDYDFVSRFIAHTKGENLPNILLHYRVHQSSLSHRFIEERNESVVSISSRAFELLLPDASLSREEVTNLQRAIKGTSAADKRRRSQLLPVYLKMWNAFRLTHKLDQGFSALNRDVIAWAARMILYPPFQEGWVKALLLLSKRDWRWPFFLLSRLPYYLARRRVS